MNIKPLLAQIDAEIAKLQHARIAIASLDSISPVLKSVNKKNATLKTRTMSAEGKARIAAAQKKRWAAQKKAVK